MKRFLVLCAFMIGSAVASFGQNTFYFPQIVNGPAGGIWKTTIFLTNPAAAGTSTASGSITLTQDTGGTNLNGAGAPMAIGFVNGNGQAVSGPVIAFQIAGGQTVKFQSTGTGSYTGGYAVVSASAPVSGTAVFSLYDGSGTNLVAEAGVPAAAALAKQAIFVDSTNNFNVGVAFANTGSSAASNVTLTVLDSNAATVLTTTIPSLGAGNHKAAFVNEFFPAIQPMIGTMQITSSSGGIAAVALRFAPSGVFTTLPPVTLASILTSTKNALAFILQTLHAHVA